MEKQDHEKRKEYQPDDTPHVVGTYDPPIASGPGPRANLEADPDQSMVIQTSAVRESHEGQPGNLILVPIEIGGYSRSRSDSDQSDQDKNGSGSKDREEQSKKEQKAAPHDRSEHEQGEKDSGREKSAGGWASTLRTMVVPAVVALVFGLIGAFAYSYFFGPGKSKDEQTSSKGSGAGKKSQSDQNTGSGKGSKAGKGSNPGQGPAPGVDSVGSEGNSQDDDEKPALITAMKELEQARRAEQAAKQESERAKAVLEFFKSSFLSAGRPGDTSLAQAFWAGGQGKDVSLRKAADVADSKVDESFSNQPLIEAAVREMLGLVYINLGDAKKSVQEYERSLSLRRAMLGFNAPETSNCRNQLAVAYRLAGRADESAKLFDRVPDSNTQATALYAQGMAMLDEGQSSQAELKLRACLEIRQKVQPDDWSTFDAKSAVGEALLQQGKYSDAEPLLLSGYEGLKHRESKIPAADRPQLVKAVDRLVRLYDSWGKKDDSARWNEELKVVRSLGGKA